jgi:hypothetical protein
MLGRKDQSARQQSWVRYFKLRSSLSEIGPLPACLNAVLSSGLISSPRAKTTGVNSNDPPTRSRSRRATRLGKAHSFGRSSNLRASFRSHLIVFGISAMGHSRRFDRVQLTSGLAPQADLIADRRHASKVPILFVKNLAKVDFWPTRPLQYSVTPIRSSLVVLVRNDVVPHIASSETHQWS